MNAIETATTEEVEEAPDRPRVELVQEPGRFSALWADLRPYLPTRSNLAAPLSGVGAGTAVLIGRGWTWLWAEGPQDALMRAGGVVLAGYAGVNTVTTIGGPFVGYITPAAVVGWCVSAKLHAPKGEEEKPMKEKKQPTTADNEDQDDEPEYLDEAEEVEVEDVAALIRAVAARHQHQGAHLDDLLAEPFFEGWGKADLKAALTDDWGLPVEGFKLFFPTPSGKRQRNREGVRLRHLPPAPARGAGEGLVRDLSPAPSQTPVEAPASTPSGAPAEATVEGAVEPSPTAPEAPS
ncbi:hypothetical protein AB0H73_36180 [Streptomyces olivoreticuli]